MNKEKSLIDINDIDSLVKLIQSPVKLCEVITGILVSDAKDWKLSTGKLVQAAIRFNFLSQLGKELNEYAKKGQIKENYFATNKNQSSLRELLEFIDEEAPDEERFKAMKSIFLMSVDSKATEKDEALAYELMQICKKLNSNDIIVLKASYDIAKGGSVGVDGGNLATRFPDEWLNIIANKIGHKIKSLVELSEENLMALKLINPRTASDRSGITTEPNFRLTQLGMKLCEFITAYP